MSQAASSSSPYRNSGLFSGYYLDDRIGDLDEWECDEEAEAAFEELTDLWESEGELLPSHKEDELLGSWIDEILDVLGYDAKQETTLPGGDGYNDRLLFESEETRREASRRKQDGNVKAMYGLSSAILEAKQYDADFDRKFDEQRSYHDASHQIRYYLDRAGGEVDWGILTNGKEWRLYGTKDYATEIYYEVDLVELLERGNLEEFKYFYAFFRPAAYRETAGTSFLDTVWNESETAAQELGEDLQDNVFTALRILGEGFVETNDLDIDPDDTEKLDELKEQSLVLLYRLMFVLYAESRGLMQPDDPEKEAEYDENFSLDQLRLEIHERISSGDSYDDYSGYSTTIWGQLQDLFSLVDTGNDSLGVPPYNGGLFDADDHEFLANNEVSDPYITEVIHRLGTTENDDGELVLADYADLDTRHLGTIYEGILEHEFRIASEEYAAVADDGGQVWKPATEVSVADAVESVEKGSLYVVNDDGERKATGAYYTPDYVVSYIVEETIDPLLDDIKTELEADGLEPSDQAYFGRFYSQLLDLKILDPAMGSAHFLTSATGYLTEQVMEIVREQELQGRNEQELRRTIAKECIYGVDINGMAVELGKLSMWLETLAADKPLAFLDHHIKTGNSLIGSDITEVLSEDNGEQNKGDNGRQLTLTESFDRARKKTLGHVMDLMKDLLDIDNNRLSDIKSMERLYDEIRSDPLYQRLFDIANVHTAEQFGLDVPEGVYKDMASAIDDSDAWEEIQAQDWFASVQTIAEEENFFNWQLEYPDVFFTEEGEMRDNAGFDAIIGNPPWVDVKGLEKPEVLFDLYQTSFNRVNIYSAFIEKSIDLLHSDSTFGFITPNSYLTQSSYQRLRELILNTFELNTLVRLPDGVFPEVTMETAITIAAMSESPERGELQTILYPREATITEIPSTQSEIYNTNTANWAKTDDKIFDIFTTKEEQKVLSQIESSKYRINDEFESCLGLTPYDKHEGHTKEQIENRVFHAETKESEEFHRLTSGEGINRYQLNWEGGEWIRYGDWLGAERERRFFTEPRCVVRQIVSTEGYGIYAAYSEETLFHTQVGFVLLPQSGSKSDAKSLTAVLNSKLITFYHKKRFLDENKDTFQKILIQDAVEFPLTDDFNEVDLSEQVENMMELVSKRSELNLNLLDYFGNYSTNKSLAEIGFTQPPTGTADSILQETTETHPNLKIGEVGIKRESVSTIEIQLTARYKPDPDKKGKDAYVETDPEPALRITDLTETEADLIEAFVPVAVDEADGFADFRDYATKRNSLVDRLRKIKLPTISEVESGLQSYLQTKERAEELEAKIEQTDELIDEIVYELYGLTDEEIEIVEEAVST